MRQTRKAKREVDQNNESLTIQLKEQQVGGGEEGSASERTVLCVS